MTNNDNESARSIREKLQYYSWQHDLVYRAWKLIPGTRVEDGASHLPIFPDGYTYRITPRKFIMRHYNFRSREQAKRKIEERLARLKDTIEYKLGWGAHYDYIAKQDYPVIADYRLLTKYQEDNNWNYEWKFHPYDYQNWGEKQTRDIFFDKDGLLKRHYPTLHELKLKLKEKNQKIKLLEEKLANSNKSLEM